MKINMTDLPGVGKKISFINGEEKLIVMIFHYTGKRELYFFEDYEDDDPIFTFKLSTEEANQLGAQFLGAALGPETGIDRERMKKIQKQAVVEWLDITKRSSFAGKSFGELNKLTPTGISIIGIFRNDDFIASPDDNSLLEIKDTLMLVGKRALVKEFIRSCEEVN